MVRSSTVALGVVGSLFAAVGAWNLYQRRTTATVPYETVATVGDVELRRYPSTVLVRTDAPSDREAFGRLFRYITGANGGNERISMTAPVEVDGRGPSVGTSSPAEPSDRGTRLSMTAPVEIETGRTESGVRMAFYLPGEYDIDSAPEPTEADLELVSVPERTLAVRRFSWRPTDSRVARESERLLETLERAAVPVGREPFFLGYDAPWTLPFLRRNEVAVEVEVEAES
ncbi:SOUL family heme-binding protein [Halomontanus rarus]|uniref:SOUL family heme-binding protein n=1 Tax=Halomontanus rarus TaxID=3034020 RepID=UPI0023E79BB0|nr:heme-binding protein [Halovivax sp. TS33]